MLPRNECHDLGRRCVKKIKWIYFLWFGRYIRRTKTSDGCLPLYRELHLDGTFIASFIEVLQDCPADELYIGRNEVRCVDIYAARDECPVR